MFGCDAETIRLVVDDDGRVLDVGRRRRTVSKRLHRALSVRDRHCQFPGCAAAVYAWHHIVHWAEGGPTNRVNLVGLCRFHHHAVHDREFVVATTGDERFTFHRPDGQLIPDNPAPPRVHGRLEDQQRDLGITPNTIVPNWLGEKLELSHVVEVLQQPPRAS